MAAADDYVLEVPPQCWKVHCVFGLEGTGSPYPQLKTPIIIPTAQKEVVHVEVPTVREEVVIIEVPQNFELQADDEELTQILEGCGMYQPGDSHVDVSSISSTLSENFPLKPLEAAPLTISEAPQEEEQEPTQPTPPIQEVKWAAEVPETIGDIQEKVKWAAWVPETIVDVQESIVDVTINLPKYLASVNLGTQHGYPDMTLLEYHTAIPVVKMVETEMICESESDYEVQTTMIVYSQSSIPLALKMVKDAVAKGMKGFQPNKIKQAAEHLHKLKILDKDKDLFDKCVALGLIKS